jgi:hypothetical protein
VGAAICGAYLWASHASPGLDPTLVRGALLLAANFITAGIALQVRAVLLCTCAGRVCAHVSSDGSTSLVLMPSVSCAFYHMQAQTTISLKALRPALLFLIGLFIYDVSSPGRTHYTSSPTLILHPPSGTLHTTPTLCKGVASQRTTVRVRACLQVYFVFLSPGSVMETVATSVEVRDTYATTHTLRARCRLATPDTLTWTQCPLYQAHRMPWCAFTTATCHGAPGTPPVSSP